MSFSQGFNPHPIMTVAMPLSVGVTADSEYIKIGFEEDYTETEIVERLNCAMPVGFKILACRKIEGKELDFAKLDRAEYVVELEYVGNSFDEKEFLENSRLLVMKKSKSGEKEADIRPYIYDFKVICDKDGKMEIKMCLAAGNKYNLKPDTVISAMEKYTDGFKVDFFATHRAKILTEDGELM